MMQQEFIKAVMSSRDNGAATNPTEPTRVDKLYNPANPMHSELVNILEKSKSKVIRKLRAHYKNDASEQMQ